MLRSSADYYDLVYSKKDYRGETDRLWELFRQFVLTQNLPNYYVEFGGHEAGVHRVHSLLGNLAIKFFCGNDDTVTNEWASKTIDKTVQYWVSLNGAQTGEGHSIG